jgi:hypothetical protein
MNSRGIYYTTIIEEKFRDVISFFNFSLQGNVDPFMNLISIDPGLGKTELVISFIKAWNERGYIPDSSILICLSTIEEINSYIKRLSFAEDKIGILTSDLVFNGYRREDAGNSRILLTTHQMMFHRTKTGSFIDSNSFHYKGHPRRLRIWDESFIPFRDNVIRVDTLKTFAADVRRFSPHLVNEMELFIDEISLREYESVLKIPRPLSIAISSELPVGGGIWNNLNQTQQDTITHIKSVANADLDLLLADGKKLGPTLINATEGVPSDFAPAFILDASGRVRATYSLWKKRAGSQLRTIANIPNDYRNLKIHHWKRAAGRTTMMDLDQLSLIADQCAQLINSNEGDWLIIHQKALSSSPSDSLKTLIETKIEKSSHKLDFLTWGKHYATNAYNDVENMVIINIFREPDVAIRAKYIGSSGCCVKHIAPNEWGDFARREHMHHLLQAICRGKVRKQEGGRAGKMRAYIISSQPPNLSQLLEETFPGCQTEGWHPVAKNLTRQQRQVVDYIVKRLKKDGLKSIAKNEIRDDLKIKQAQGLTRVLKDKTVLHELGLNGISVETRKLVADSAN